MTTRRLAAPLALSALLASAAVAGTAKQAKKPAGPKTPSEGFFPMNTADLPNRCAPDRFYLDLQSGQWLVHGRARGVDADDQAINSVVTTYNPDSPTLATYVYKKTDYFHRRAEMQRKFEEKIFSLSGKEREQGLRNYSYLMLYLGEFQKIVDYFGPGGRGERPEDGIVAFALAQAYFRLGRYQESAPYARRAYQLMPDKMMDTRWQIMLTDLGIYGDALLDRNATDYYDLRHVRTLFPNRDWSNLPFEDVTSTSGIVAWAGTGSVSFADLDGDGWDDLLLQYKNFPSRIYKNLQGKGWQEVPPVGGKDMLCNQLTEIPVDFDNDGLPGLHRQCCNYDGPGTNTLLKNLGNFQFKDVTAGSGLDYHVSGMDDDWADYDLDGNLDLVVADHWGPVRLYHNNGDGTFTDVTKKAGVITQGSPARGGPGETIDIDEQEEEQSGAVSCSWGDYNGDRYPDLFCNGWNWSKLFRNNGDGTFTDVTKEVGLKDGKGVKGYNSMWIDFNNTGRLDLFAGRYVANSSDRWGFGPRCTCSNLLSKAGFSKREWRGAGTIYRNNGDGTFTDMIDTTRLLPVGVMGVNAADWDNSGRIDLLEDTGGPYMQQAEPYLFYRNDGGYKFTLMTPFTMGALWGKGHGSAFGDYDHDGFLDLILNNGGAHPGDVWKDLLLHNKGDSGYHWLGVKLKGGPGTNKMGVGAQVEIWAGNGLLHQTQQLSAGSRFPGTSSFLIHFGLNRFKKVDRLVVRWPNKKKDDTELTDVPCDQAIEIDEAGGSYRQLWSAPVKARRGARKTAETAQRRP